MRLVIDLQGAQGSSHGRGIGRLSRALALAMVRAPGRHDPVVLLNDAMPETAEQLYEDFAAILPRENIRIWRGLTNIPAISGPQSMARRHASELIRAHFISGLKCDLIHVASVVEGAGDDVVSNWPVSLDRLPQVATFYDAIPLILRDQYLRGAWRSSGLATWYMRQLHELQQCEGLLAISESSRNEAIDHLGCDPARVFNMQAGFDAALFRPVRLGDKAHAEMLARYGLRDSFVLFVGAGDIRKNELGLLKAYAFLPKSLRAAHQLVIVGAMEPMSLQKQAAELGVKSQDLVLLKRVTEQDLPALYSICKIFVMPSKHEGFGLPALEAMACGAPVIASNTTSLPEVVGLEDALFNPQDPASIAERLRLALVDDCFRERLAKHGLAQAAKFTWAESARRAWEGLEAVQDQVSPRNAQSNGSVPGRRLKLACVGPLPPDESGIAAYMRDLLPDLAGHYDITLVTNSGATDDPVLQAIFPVISEDDFGQVEPGFDRVLYQVGNSQFHSSIVRNLLPRHPGVVVLHDSYVCNIPFLEFVRTHDENALARDLFDSHGWRAIQALELQPAAEAIQQFPCAVPVFRNALAVIQHSVHAKDIAASYIGPDAAALVRLLPQLRASWTRIGRHTARAMLGLDIDAPLICTFGIVHTTKRPFDVLEAWHIAMRNEVQARLVFVGGISPEMSAELEAYARRHGFGSRLIVTGRVDADCYWQWLEAADIAVQLRAQSRGETSRAIVDAMSVGVPVIANAHGSAAELPAGSVLLLPDDTDAPQVAAALAALWANPARRAALGDAATEYSRTVLAPRRIASLYRDVIEDAYQAGAPARLRAALPNLPEDDLPGAARALAQSFQAVGPKRLLLDAKFASISDRGAGSVMRDMAKQLLIDPGEAWVADMIQLDLNNSRYGRQLAAAFLRLPDRGLQDELVAGSERDTAVLLVGIGSASPFDPKEPQRLRRRGMRAVTLIHEGLPEADDRLQDIASFSDALLFTSQGEAEVFVGRLNGLDTRRLHPLDIGWLDFRSDDLARAAFLAAVHAGRWAMHWSPPRNLC
jgi:glycosyltransferase involved in cell wall biosynthesis